MSREFEQDGDFIVTKRRATVWQVFANVFGWALVIIGVASALGLGWTVVDYLRNYWGMM